MTFFAHQNFPKKAVELLRLYDFANIILYATEEYGDATVAEWIKAVGKSARPQRPTVIMFDDGIKQNAVSLRAMRESSCTFVRFTRKWSDEPWQGLAWRLLKYWSEVVEQSQYAEDAAKPCLIDVSITGKIHTINL